MPDRPTPDVADDPDQSRFTAHLGDQLAGAAYYRVEGDRVVFTHTEVDDAFEGQGVGSALARGALDLVRRRGAAAVPVCPFIAGWIDRHDDYADLVDHERLAELTQD